MNIDLFVNAAMRTITPECKNQTEIDDAKDLVARLFTASEINPKDTWNSLTEGQRMALDWYFASVLSACVGEDMIRNILSAFKMIYCISKEMENV